jgi:hypothetical protein
MEREKKALYFLLLVPSCVLLHTAGSASRAHFHSPDSLPAGMRTLIAQRQQHQVAIKKRKWHSPDISIYTRLYSYMLFSG